MKLLSRIGMPVAIATLATLVLAAPPANAEKDKGEPEPQFASAVAIGEGLGPHEVTQLELDAAGNPVVIMRFYSSRTFQMVRCGDATCTTVASSAEVPASTQLDPSGHPFLLGDTDAGLTFTACLDSLCTEQAESVVLAPGAENITTSPTVKFGADGNLVVAALARTQLGRVWHNSELVVIRCSDPTCTGPRATNRMDLGLRQSRLALTMDHLDRPIIVRSTRTTTEVMACPNPSCQGSFEISTTTGTYPFRGFLSAEVDSTGRMVMLLKSRGVTLRVCPDVSCATHADFGLGNAYGHTYEHRPSLTLTSDDRPIVSFIGSNYIFKRANVVRLAECVQPGCVDGDVRIVQTNPWSGRLGHTMLRLDHDQRPVLGYSQGQVLRLVRCPTTVLCHVQPPLQIVGFVTYSSVNGTWALFDDGTRFWLGSRCADVLDGYEVEVVKWADIAEHEPQYRSPFAGCADLALMVSPISR